MGNMYIDKPVEDDQQAMSFVQERAVMKEWMYLQQALLHFASTASQRRSQSWRTIFERFIAQITENRARTWWKSASIDTAASGSRFVEARYRQHRYGALELAAGYLDCSVLPGIPQLFADICALLIYTAEHERFMQYQLAQLPTAISNASWRALTPREKEVLQGLIGGGIRVRYGTTTRARAINHSLACTTAVYTTGCT